MNLLPQLLNFLPVAQAGGETTPTATPPVTTLPVANPPGAASTEARPPSTVTMTEWAWPDDPTTWILLVLGGAAIIAYVVWLYRKDTRELGTLPRLWLTTLRIAMFVGLLVIWLNPQERTQESMTRPSRVAILIDNSLSMRHPAADARTGSPAEGAQPTPETAGMGTGGETRAELVQKLLAQSPLLQSLRQQHEVSIFTFNSLLQGPVTTLPLAASNPADTANPPVVVDPAKALNWVEVTTPAGLETRLGESLSDAIRQLAGRTLSGMIVVSDGANNAGIDLDAARDRAIAQKVKFVTLGVGGTEPPRNVQLADLQAPTDVQVGDPFDVVAFLTAQGLSGQKVNVELLAKGTDDPTETTVSSQELVITGDNVPLEAKFELKADKTGSTRYTIRAKPAIAVQEVNLEDNLQSLTINALDKPTRVLLIAGGPMRDYQFVRNLLFRHKGIDVDVLLQTGSMGTSQESDNLLTSFPSSREELYSYDVVIAFDPDWRLIPPESIDLLYDWVFQEAGGLIVIAGDVNTLQVAAVSAATAEQSALGKQLAKLQELYPVVLNSYLSDLRFDQEHSQPWPLAFTPEGEAASFLQMTDEATSSLARWKEFTGFYKCYPTSGPKAGATVYSRFSDPRSESAIVMASQFFGQGRTFYLGSGEMWRLRSVDEEDYDRFWIKAIREFSQGRLKRGNRRGLLMPETRRIALGQTVRVRARLLDTQFQPLSAPSIPLELLDPTGRPVIPPRVLTADPNRPGEFVGDFRASLAGVYKLAVEIPQSSERLQEEVTVALPKLEDENIRQNVAGLKNLAEGTGGAYFNLSEMRLSANPAAAANEAGPEKIVALFPNRAEQILIDQRLKTLWDREWVLFVLVGLVSVEWLTRKLLKLA
jgi:hypothetical protein